MSASSAPVTPDATPAVNDPCPGLDQRRRRRDARLLALVVALAGVVNVVSGLTPEIAARVHLVAASLTPDVRELARGATALMGLALILVARGLAHRRRLAFLAAITMLGVSVVTHVAKGLDVEESALNILLLVLLLRSRRWFTAPGDPASMRLILAGTALLSWLLAMSDHLPSNGLATSAQPYQLSPG